MFRTSASVDRIYLDPSFNSNRSYNVLFREANGTAAAPCVRPPGAVRPAQPIP
jgi:hypothetical protein